jgi:hypothetical protein
MALKNRKSSLTSLVSSIAVSGYPGKILDSYDGFNFSAVFGRRLTAPNIVTALAWVVPVTPSRL